MSPPTPDDDVLAAVRDFVARADALDPTAEPAGELEVRLGGREVRLPLRTPVALALVRALRDYQDPRYFGTCDYCDSPRLDENFLCRDCGRSNGLFGQMITEWAARYTESPGIGPPPGGPAPPDDRPASG